MDIIQNIKDKQISKTDVDDHSSKEYGADVEIVDIDETLDSRKSSWIILGSFIIHFVVFGIHYSFGVYHNYFVVNNLFGTSDASMIGAVSAGSLPVAGLFAGRIADSIGYKTTITIGATLMAIGLIGAAFSIELWQYIFCQGLLFGIGSALAYLPAVSVPSFWFVKYRGLASGLAVSGSGIGGFIFSLFIQKLLEKFDLRWTLIITGLISFVFTVFGALMIKVPRSLLKKKSGHYPVSLFRSPFFVLLYLMSAFGFLGYYAPIVLVPSFATTKLFQSSSDGALAIGLFNASSTVGRISIGITADKFFGRLNSLIACFFFSGLSILGLWMTATSFTHLLIFCITYGILVGGVISLFPVVIAEYFGVEMLASKVGLFFTCMAFGNLAGPPIAGKLLVLFTDGDGVTDWIPAILFSGLTMLSSVLFGIMIKCLLWRQARGSLLSSSSI